MPSLRLRPLHLLPRAPLLSAPRLARPYYSSSSSSPPPGSNNNTAPFAPGPSPPRLPAAEQAEFERLQRAAAERLVDPIPIPIPDPAPAPAPAATTAPAAPAPAAGAGAGQDAGGGGVWRGAPPEFEGDRNPRTGEVGGPKTEPLRWGSGGDWSYNGRVTDF